MLSKARRRRLCGARPGYAHRRHHGVRRAQRADDGWRAACAGRAVLRDQRGALALTYASLVVHELTAIIDVAYADGRREVTPTEQHVHGFLERVPLMATAFLSVLHWDQARSLVGAGEDPDW